MLEGSFLSTESVFPCRDEVRYRRLEGTLRKRGDAALGRDVRWGGGRGVPGAAGADSQPPPGK